MTPTAEQPCQCLRCLDERDARTEDGIPVTMARMIVCSTCGNKRCPHASDHRYACTGSNAVGQPGSVYAAHPVPTAEQPDAERHMERLNVLAQSAWRLPLGAVAAASIGWAYDELTRLRGVEADLAATKDQCDSFHAAQNELRAEVSRLKEELEMWRPMTIEEAEQAYRDAPDVPLSEERIKEIVRRATDPAERLPNNEQGALAAELTRLRTAYAELRDAVWATPSDETHERTLAQAADQAAAFHEVTREDGMRAELTRLRGIIAQHDLCHDLHGKVGPKEFADGCAAEQRKLYGCAPDRDAMDRLVAENERLREALKPFAEAAETIYMGDHGEEAYADPDDCRRAAAALAEKEKP